MVRSFNRCPGCKKGHSLKLARDGEDFYTCRYRDWSCFAIPASWSSEDKARLAALAKLNGKEY